MLSNDWIIFKLKIAIMELEHHLDKAYSKEELEFISKF